MRVGSSPADSSPGAVATAEMNASSPASGPSYAGASAAFRGRRMPRMSPSARALRAAAPEFFAPVTGPEAEFGAAAAEMPSSALSATEEPTASSRASSLTRAACLARPSTAMSPAGGSASPDGCCRRSAQEQRVAQGTEPDGDVVDRRRGDHEQAEGHQGDQPQVGQPDPDGGHDRRGDQPADPATGCTHRLGPVARAGRALRQCPDPGGRCQQDPGPDGEPAGGGSLVRVPQHTQRCPEQEQRDHDVQGAHQAGHDRGDDAGQPPVDREPGHGGHHDRQGEQKQADSVATVRGVQISGATAHGAHHSAEDRGQEEPDARQEPAGRPDHPRHRTRVPTRRRLGRGARDRARRSAPGLGGS